MDLTQQTSENLEYMIDEIKKKLKMLGSAAIKPQHFQLSQYEDVKDIYDHVQSKSQFSINEMETLVMELGRLRKGQ